MSVFSVATVAKKEAVAQGGPNDPIAVFHRGRSGGLWYNMNGRNGAWSGDTQVPDIGISAQPSAINYNGKVMVFHQGNRDNGALWYVTRDAGGWGQDQGVPDTGMSEGPSAVFYNGLLHVFHQGRQNSGELWYNVFDGNNWQGDRRYSGFFRGMSYSPSAVVYGNDLYVFCQGVGERRGLAPSGGYPKGDGQLYYVIWSAASSSWSAENRVPNTGISGSPAALVYNNKIYVFHEGSGNNGALWYNVFDGNSWSGDNAVPNVGISDNPGPVLRNGTIAVFHQGRANNQSLWATWLDDKNWAPDAEVQNTGLTFGPSAVAWPFA